METFFFQLKSSKNFKKIFFFNLIKILDLFLLWVFMLLQFSGFDDDDGLKMIVFAYCFFYCRRQDPKWG